MAGTVLITGANGTLVLGTVRNTSAASDTNTARLIKVANEHPNARLVLRQLDLGSLEAVRSFADEVSAQVSNGELPRISAIICNATTLSLEDGQRFTADGYEATFQVSHLSHYMMVLRLLRSMDTSTGRVVMLGSATHYPEKRNPLSSFRPGLPAEIHHLVKPVPDGPGEAHDRGQQRYGTAKLANVIFMNDLNHRLQTDPVLSAITVTAVDPGGLPASRSQAVQKPSVRRMMAAIDFAMPLLKYVTSVMRPTSEAARDVVAMSVDKQFKGQRGYFIGRRAAVEAEVAKEAKVQQALWAACWKWTGMSHSDTSLKKTAIEG